MKYLDLLQKRRRRPWAYTVCEINNATSNNLTFDVSPLANIFSFNMARNQTKILVWVQKMGEFGQFINKQVEEK